MQKMNLSYHSQNNSKCRTMNRVQLTKITTQNTQLLDLAESATHLTDSKTTVDVERFAGLNIRGFSPLKFFAEIPSRRMATSVHYLRIAKNSWENFRGKPKNREIRGSLAQ